MLVDCLSESPTVITGSANFSLASVENNDENMLVVRGNRRVADLYYVEFMRLFGHFGFRDEVARGEKGEKAQGETRRGWAEEGMDQGGRKWADRRLALDAFVPAPDAPAQFL